MNERLNKLRRELAVRFDDLLADSIEEIEQAAVEQLAHQSDEDDSPPKAKVAAKLEWQAGSSRPHVRVSLGWSVSHKTEMEADLDFDQIPLGIEQGGEA